MKKNVVLLLSSSLFLTCSSHLVSNAASVSKIKLKNVNSQSAVKKEDSKSSLQNQSGSSKASEGSVVSSTDKRPASGNSDAPKGGSAVTKSDSTQGSSTLTDSSKNVETKGNLASTKDGKVASSFKRIETKKITEKANTSLPPGTVKDYTRTKLSRANNSVKSANPPEEESDTSSVKSAAPESWTVESENAEASNEENFDAVKQSASGGNKAFDDSKWLLYGGIGLVICAFLCATFFMVLARRRMRSLKKSCISGEDEA